MKIKITSLVTDKKTGKYLHVGDIVDFDEERAQRAITLGVAVKVEEVEEKEKPKRKRAVKKQA